MLVVELNEKVEALSVQLAARTGRWRPGVHPADLIIRSRVGGSTFAVHRLAAAQACWTWVICAVVGAAPGLG